MPTSQALIAIPLLTLLTAIPLTTSAQDSGELETADLGWPRVIKKDGATVTLFQPQIQNWENHATLKAALAVSVALAGTDAGDPTYGALYFSAPTTVSFDDRSVIIGQRELTDISFPGRTQAETTALTAAVNAVLNPQQYLEVSLDRIVANLELTSHQAKKVTANLDPPPIFHSTTPAVLVVFLGEPKFEAVPGTGLLFAVNTNWDAFLHLGSSKYYLLNHDQWLVSDDPKKGWAAATSLPDDFQKLPDSEEWTEVRKNLTAKPADTTPKVFYSDRPAELIITDGAPSMAVVPGTKLLHVTNTESDVFLNAADSHFYFLTAGRWFKSKFLAGPWAAATQTLPGDFAKIPDDHQAADVLVSVPGTAEADEAILMASIPKKATVDRSTATLDVAYQGEPEFLPVPDAATVFYARNTTNAVFRVSGRYFCCHNAVWFESATATGSWVVCTKVPPAIYSIPSTHPYHNVTYVYVYDSTPDTVVVGHTSGYNGSYIVGATVMFGLGIWIGSELDDHWHHYQHAHYYSYGCGAHYSHYHGGYHRGYHAYYGPYGGAGRVATYNHRTGTYSRAAYAAGPGGARFARQAYNPRTGTWAAQTGYRSPYQSWGRSVVTRDDDWVRTGHYRQGNKMIAGLETSDGNAAAVRRNGLNRTAIGKKDDDIYVGRNGNLYRRDEDSSNWKKLDDGKWNNVDSAKIDRKEVSKRVDNRTTTIINNRPKTGGAGTVDRTRLQNIQRPTTPYRGTSSRNYGTGVGGQLNRDAYARQRGDYRTTQSRTRSGAGFSRSAPASGGSRLNRSPSGRTRRR